MHIAGYTMKGWKGEVPAMASAVLARERAGTDGYTFVLQGKRSPAFGIQTRSTHATLATARARAADYEALAATFVNLQDPGGRAYGKVLVLGVTCNIAPVLHSTDGNYAVIAANWSLQRGR